MTCAGVPVFGRTKTCWCAVKSSHNARSLPIFTYSPHSLLLHVNPARTRDVLCFPRRSRA